VKCSAVQCLSASVKRLSVGVCCVCEAGLVICVVCVFVCERERAKVQVGSSSSGGGGAVLVQWCSAGYVGVV